MPTLVRTPKTWYASAAGGLTNLHAARRFRISLLSLQQVVWLARALWLACLLLSSYVFLATLTSRARQMQDIFVLNSAAFERLGFTRDLLPAYVIGLDSLAFLVYAMVGVLIFSRKSSEFVALFGSLALVTAGFTIARPADSLFFVDVPLRLPTLLLFMLGTGSILLFLFLFPDGHFVPRWMMGVALLVSGVPVLASLQQVLAFDTLSWPPPTVAHLSLPAVALGAGAQIYRYRRVSSPSQRQQTKWVVFGLSLGAAGLLSFLLFVPMLVPQVMQGGMERATYILLGVPLFYISLMLLPLSIAMSILRFRLWDIDLIIRRTILYVTLTAVVAGLFAAAITLGQKVFMSLTGQRSDMAAVLATLLVVAVITPLKDYMQRYIDRCLKSGPEAAHRLQVLIDRVNSRVSPVEPQQISRRLLDESVAAYNAKGGAVYWDSDGKLKMIYRTADWDGDARATAVLQSTQQATRIGVIALGARRSEEEYREQDTRFLQQAASAVALAIEQDRPSPET